MLKILYDKIGEYKKETILTPLFMLGEVAMECLIPAVMAMLIDQMNTDYVKLARSEGLSEREIFSKHILKNAAIPILHGVPGAILFATATCPNCKIAAALLEKAQVPFEKVLAENNADLAHQYDIKQAPTLVVIDENGISKHLGVSDIKKFIESK